MIAEVPAIVARALGVRRGGRWLLRPATFGVAEGVIGIAGPRGAGRTTLLATLATLRRPHVGALEVLGYDARTTAGRPAIRGRIGYLPAGLDWARGLRVQEFVAYTAFYRRVDGAAAPAILERMEMSEAAGWELGRLPADLRLRAGLAATCVHDPDLVLLDEPLRGLAAGQAAEVTSLLPVLAPTVVVTAADPAELTGWCDRVFTLARGRLTELTAPPRPRTAAESPPERALVGAVGYG